MRRVLVLFLTIPTSVSGCTNLIECDGASCRGVEPDASSGNGGAGGNGGDVDDPSADAAVGGDGGDGGGTPDAAAMTDPPDAAAMSHPPDAAVCVPSQEVCDGRDNDCDGQIDDGVVVATGGFTALGSALQRISGSGSILTVCGSQPCGGTSCIQCAPLTITGATLSGEFAGSIKSVNATAGGLTVCGVVYDLPYGTVCTTISTSGASLSGGLSAYAITGLEVLGGVSGTTIAVSGLDQCPGGPGGDTTFTCPVSSTMTVDCPF